MNDIHDRAQKTYALAIACVDCPWCGAEAGTPCPTERHAGCHMTRVGRFVEERHSHPEWPVMSKLRQGDA